MISIRREVLTNPPKMSGCARAALLIEQPLFREAEKKEDVIIYFHQHHYILILHFFISILISIFKLVHQYFRSILVKKKQCLRSVTHVIIIFVAKLLVRHVVASQSPEVRPLPARQLSLQWIFTNWILWKIFDSKDFFRNLVSEFLQQDIWRKKYCAGYCDHIYVIYLDISSNWIFVCLSEVWTEYLIFIYISTGMESVDFKIWFKYRFVCFR